MVTSHNNNSKTPFSNRSKHKPRIHLHHQTSHITVDVLPATMNRLLSPHPTDSRRTRVCWALSEVLFDHAFVVQERRWALAAVIQGQYTLPNVASSEAEIASYRQSHELVDAMEELAWLVPLVRRFRQEYVRLRALECNSSLLSLFFACVVITVDANCESFVLRHQPPPT
jgi:hypothetical protein